MNNDNLWVKVSNVLKIAPRYTLADSFILLKDVEGWTDGFIADITNINLENMRTLAMIKNSKGKGLARYTIDKDKCPEIKLIAAKVDERITNGESEAVADIEWDLLDNMVMLKSERHAVKCNPKYIRYFHDAYKQLSSSITLHISGSNNPIDVRIGDRIGLIMPIRQDEL